MTENPSLNNTAILTDAEKRQADYDSLTASGGIKTGVRPRGPFALAAHQSATAPTAAYDGQDFISKFLINMLLMLTGKLDADNAGNNSLISMISKAFGMSDDTNHSEFRQLQQDVRTRGRETVREERDYTKFDKDVAAAAVKMGEPVLGKNIYNSQMLELIGKGESNGDYNRVYGKAGRIDLTNMTINQVIAWQKQYTDNGSASSAAGKYQIIRKTLEATTREMGLTGNEKYDQAMQDRMAKHLLDKRGYTALLEGRMSEAEFANRVSKEWASLKGTNGRGAYDGDGLNSAKISAGHTIAAARQDKTIMASFDEARIGAPKPPQTNDPIVVIDTAPTAAETVPQRRPQATALGMG